MSTTYEYTVSLPQDYREDAVYPAIFLLHGKGSNEQDMLSLTQPLSGQFIRIGIRGNLPLGGGYQYYELKSLGNPIREQFDAAIEQLTASIRELSRKYRIDPARRYLLGFSQGAILSMSLGLTLGDELKSLVALNGYVPAFVQTEYTLKEAKQLSVFISHGEYDNVFPVQIGHDTANYLRTRIPGLTFRTYPSGHGVIPENRQDIVNWLCEDAGLTN